MIPPLNYKVRRIGETKELDLVIRARSTTHLVNDVKYLWVDTTLTEKTLKGSLVEYQANEFPMAMLQPIVKIGDDLKITIDEPNLNSILSQFDLELA